MHASNGWPSGRSTAPRASLLAGVQPVLVAQQIGRQGLCCIFHAIDMANHDNGAWRVRNYMLADRAQ